MTQPNQSKQYVTSENNYVTPTSGKSETLCNQSELVETVLSILGIVDRTSGNRPEQIATLEQELNAYITANYTANKEVMELRLTNAAKLANLDQKIQTMYTQEEVAKRERVARLETLEDIKEWAVENSFIE